MLRPDPGRQRRVYLRLLAIAILSTFIGVVVHLMVITVRTLAWLHSIRHPAGGIDLWPPDAFPTIFHRLWSPLGWYSCLGVIGGVLTALVLTRPWVRSDSNTRCRRCDYILHGITEPRCPECGERI